MIVDYELDDGVATITMDDGKANVMSPQMLGELNSALDRAVEDRAVVLLAGRKRIFSGGFDLEVFGRGPEPALEMLIGGAELLERLLGFPTPVVAACGGHALAMGAFLLLAADYRIGVEGNFKLGFNEIRIGMPLPRFAVEVARQRLTPVALSQTLLARMYRPDEAVVAGYLDEVVTADRLGPVALERASEFASLSLGARRVSKPVVRGQALAALRRAIDEELTLDYLAAVAG